MKPLHLDVVDQWPEDLLKKCEKRKIRRNTKNSLTESNHLVLLIYWLQRRWCHTTKLISLSAFWADSFLWRIRVLILGIVCLNFIKWYCDVLFCILNPCVIPDTDANKEQVLFLVDVIQQIIFLVVLRRKLHVGWFQDETFQVCITKWHNFYCLVFGFSTPYFLNGYSWRKYETGSLLLHLWDIL